MQSFTSSANKISSPVSPQTLMQCVTCPLSELGLWAQGCGQPLLCFLPCSWQTSFASVSVGEGWGGRLKGFLGLSWLKQLSPDVPWVCFSFGVFGPEAQSKCQMMPRKATQGPKLAICVQVWSLKKGVFGREARWLASHRTWKQAKRRLGQHGRLFLLSPGWRWIGWAADCFKGDRLGWIACCFSRRP